MAKVRQAMAKKKIRPGKRVPQSPLSFTTNDFDSVTPRTVVYIHGIDNKPPASILKCQWDTSLFGVPQQDRTRMAYWVNRNYYPTSLPGDCFGVDSVAQAVREPTPLELMSLAASEVQGNGALGAPGVEVQATIELLSRGDSAKRRALEQLAHDVETTVRLPETYGDFGAESWIPPVAWRWITEKVTASLLRDVHDFFYDRDRYDVMVSSLRRCLEETAGPHVVIAHSQGSMIAYELLRSEDAAKYDVPLLLTIGSPLGLPMVQAEFRKPEFVGSTGDSPLPFPRVRRWVNVSAGYDIVCAVKELAGYFDGPIEDHRIANPEGWRNAHSATGYLRSDPVQATVRGAVGPDFGQQTGEFVVARDLINDLHDQPGEARHSVLVQIKGDRTLDDGHQRIREVLYEIVAGNDDEAWKTCVYDRLRRFVSVKLTRREIEALRRMVLQGALGEVDLDVKLWKNAKKFALTHQSIDTLQVRPANTSYLAAGEGVNWAVLDTGIRFDHPHFATHESIVRQWNCLQPGPPREERFAVDPNGHGTHVAGIIAGAIDRDLRLTAPGRTPSMIRPAGMAPRAKLHGYTVLDQNGRGSDASVIKALDHIAETNEKAASLVIHGINVSLGGYFDATMYGCGHSPVCSELRRLWRQGVVIVVAAGNAGQVAVVDIDRNYREINTSASIGDPANLGDAIAVGSVHKTNPHMNGVSYFSSRGPTMDGRNKPDCVAPGERILSARSMFADANSTDADRLYVELSGTSMAAPHVSGLLAAFLSIRREFIGHPDRVKEILKSNCTDLHRDPYTQGRGLPNLIRMLVST
jgi:hypothetical protein